jgi:hypothetical protein
LSKKKTYLGLETQRCLELLLLLVLLLVPLLVLR